MGMIRTAIGSAALVIILAGCEGVVMLSDSTPLDPLARYTGTECFYEDSLGNHPFEFEPPAFVFKEPTQDEKAKVCEDRAAPSDRAILVTGLRVRPGYELEYTAVDAGQEMNASSTFRFSQSSIPHFTPLAIRFVAPVENGGYLKTLEEGFLLAALTTRRHICFGTKSGCDQERHAEKIRAFFDTHAIDLWNALITDMRLIALDPRHFTATKDRMPSRGTRWGAFFSRRGLCTALIEAKTQLSSNEKQEIVKLFSSFYERKRTSCDFLSSTYQMIPRYLYSMPTAMLLVAVTKDEKDKNSSEPDGYFGKHVMARHSTVEARPRTVSPNFPGSARNWTLKEWEWSGICDRRQTARTAGQHDTFAIRSLRAKGSSTTLRLPAPNEAEADGLVSYEFVEQVSESADWGLIRRRMIRPKADATFGSKLVPTVERSTLDHLYAEDVAELTWHRTTEDGVWAGGGGTPAAGCTL